MNFLIGEILLCLVAASVLGVLVGWLLKTVFTGKRVSRVEAEWDSKFRTLDASRKKEIDEISVKNDQLHNDITTQRNKLVSLQSTLETKDKALLESRAETKTLNSSLEGQHTAIESARLEADQIATKQKDIKQRLEAIVASKDREIEELKTEIKKADNNSQGTGSPKASIDGRANSASTTAAFSEDTRIKTLNEQRDRLIRERRQLEAREEHFSSRLTHGDDTRAYLDETIQMDQQSREWLDRSQQVGESRAKTPSTDSSAQTPTTGAPTQSSRPATTATSTPVTSTTATSTTASSTLADARPTEEPNDDDNPKTLWDKVKSTVNKTVDKTKI